MKFNKTFLTYNNRDCVGTVDAALDVRNDLREIGMLGFYDDFERELSDAVYQMQMRGVPVDDGRLNKARQDKIANMENIQRSIAPGIGVIIGEPNFNPNSPIQIAKLLQAFGYHSGRRTPKGALKADKEEIITALLKAAGNELEGMWESIVDYRAESKDVGTFLSPVVAWADGRVRAKFLVTARSGRLESKKWVTPWGTGPEFQNIPDDLRYVYVAPKGYVFVQADAVQLELVILANEAGVKSWLGAITRGESIHIRNMIDVIGVTEEVALHAKNAVGEEHKQYVVIKNLAFGDSYGAETKTIQSQLLTKARILIAMDRLEPIMARYRARLPEIPTWRTKSYENAMRTRAITNRFGRVRPLHEPDDKIAGISANNPIQSTAADFINIGFLKLHHRGAEIVNQVHDSVLILCKAEDKEMVRDWISKDFSHTIPMDGLDVSIKMDIQYGESWGEMQPF